MDIKSRYGAHMFVELWIDVAQTLSHNIERPHNVKTLQHNIQDFGCSPHNVEECVDIGGLDVETKETLSSQSDVEVKVTIGTSTTKGEVDVEASLDVEDTKNF
ncbi:hypothetical protein NDU88_005344 [Pleurodeles waltl]|uniref:Uncharacterized protein n=1 Tax=Pleurodeles waltl TaxID=8319 RepID=A0AAV7QKW6_PLEWA|nr:hypothetical protein NDU88_005344 [Pleurodeles waltl]